MIPGPGSRVLRGGDHGRWRQLGAGLRRSGRAQQLTTAPRGAAVSLQESERMAGAGSQHHPQGVAGGAVAGASAVSPTAAGPGEDSSDSEAEQEGPQKLIRKVSTSGQMRTKVRLGRGPARGLWAEGTLWEIPGTGIRRRGAGARPGWGVASRRGPFGALGIPAVGLRDI